MKSILLIGALLLSTFHAGADTLQDLKSSFENAVPAQMKDYPRLTSFNKIDSPYRCMSLCEGGNCRTSGLYEMAIGRFENVNGEEALSDSLIIQVGPLSNALVLKMYEGSEMKTFVSETGELRTSAVFESGTSSEIAYRKSGSDLIFMKVAKSANGSESVNYGYCRKD